METKDIEETALEALATINGDDIANHEIKGFAIPENNDPQVRFCEDNHNGITEYYLLKRDAHNTFIEYVKGDSPDIPPLGWKKIPRD